MVVIGFGYLIGRIRVGPIELGPVTGVLIAALVFGHLGLAPSGQFLNLGFMFFIYCVGLQAGPSFFSVVRQDGIRYASLVLVCAVSAVATIVLLRGSLGLSPSLSAGVLAGSLTSSPTLAAARDAITSGLVVVPPGSSADVLTREVAIGYALTYLVGLVGLLVLVQLLPALLRIDLAAAAGKVSQHMRLPDSPEERLDRLRGRWRPVAEIYRVEEGVLTAGPLGEVGLPDRTGCLVNKVQRGDELLDPRPDLRLQPGDLVQILGPPEAHPGLREIVGPLDFAPELHATEPTFREVRVSSSDVVGKTLRDLAWPRRYGCYVLGVNRALIELPVGPDFVVEKGDTLLVYGSAERLLALGKAVGHIEEKVHQTDLLTFAFGIAVGLLIGDINLRIGQVSVGLGQAGGLLLSGILVGFLRSSNPRFGRVPQAAQWILMELGLLLFMTGIGLRAGAGIVEAMGEYGLRVLASGALVLLAPVLSGWVVGTYVLRMNPAVLLGALTGALTSTPALGMVSRAARSSVPALGYAGAYPLANILLALAGATLVRS